MMHFFYNHLTISTKIRRDMIFEISYDKCRYHVRYGKSPEIYFLKIFNLNINLNLILDNMFVNQ